MTDGSGIADTAQLRADADRITLLTQAAAERGQLDTVVPACPGWALRDLVVHLGSVHRWATECVLHATAPAGTLPVERRVTDDALVDWYAESAAALADSIDAAPPDTPTWTPFPIESPTVAVWTRRQTQETSLHRRDAEEALGELLPIDPSVAADGVDEYLSVIVPRIVQRDARTLPSGSVHLHCTDTEGEWTVEVVDGTYLVDRAHRKGDAAVRGTAESVLLRLWGRQAAGRGLDVLGDADVADAWLSIGGN